MNRSVIERSVTGFVGAIALGAAVVAAVTPAEASGRRTVAAGIIGGMSAAEVMGGPYYPSYGSYYPSYPAPVYFVPPDGPPPGCVIRNQRVWNGDGWRWRKLRVCH
jgi:hypothetical protein